MQTVEPADMPPCESLNKEWVAISNVAPMLGLSRETLMSMIENGSVSCIASGNRKYVNIEQTKEELKCAAEANRQNVRAHRAASPYGRRKIASKLGMNQASPATAAGQRQKPTKIVPVG